MAYIGNRPEQGNFRKCDAITTSATATYNLLVGGVAVNPNQNQCIVSLNGVIQSSGNSYTIASSQITFASALTSSDVIDFILILGDTLDAGVPSDDSVGLAQLSASGSPSSSNYLRGDNSWQTVSAGTSLSGSTDNTVTTVTGANAIQGETNFIYNGTIAGLGATGANADLGVGLHIRTSDSSGSVSADADELVLESSAGVGMTMLGGTGNDLAIDFGDSGGSQRGRLIYANNGDNMMFHTAGAEAMRINDNGSLLINRTNAAPVANDDTTLQVHQDVNSSMSFAIHNVATSGVTGMIVNYAGIGSGGGGIFYDAQDDNDRRFKVDGDGDCENTNNSYGALSDERLKENIVDANSQWEDIKKIKFKKFNKKEDSTIQLGVIAQDLETAGMNGLVKENDPNKHDIKKSSEFGTLDKDGEIETTTGEKVKSVKYSVLLLKSAKALQEAITKIETLETENIDIKARLTALENA